MIRLLEELSMNAIPSMETAEYDGWILRFSHGVTRRANSVNPLYSSTIDIDEKIKFCEELYVQHKLPVYFKLTRVANPPDLDQILEHKGYRLDTQNSVQMLSLREFKSSCWGSVRLSEKSEDDWLLRFMRFNGYE